MRILFLGTGTSTGIPQIGCNCLACTSNDPHDRRLRTSAIVSTDDGSELLIDCGPDFRTQVLGSGQPSVGALLITHSHYDHVGGIDDLRPYCKDSKAFPVYCRQDVADDLRQRNPWSFAEHPYPGVPTFDIHVIEEYKPFIIGKTEIMPLAVMHGRLSILGYRIGPLAYITDCSYLPDRSIDMLRGVDTLVVNALRHRPHPSHMSLSETLNLVSRVKPRWTWLTHVSHDMGPEALVQLPAGVMFAHDRLSVNVPAFMSVRAPEMSQCGMAAK